MKNKQDTVRQRVAKDKELIIEQLKKTPIVSLACEKTGISRATYYRWKNSDTRFSAASDSAIAEGSLLINDMAESQLLSAIKDKNLTAIIFWLKNHHSSYETRIELRSAVANTDKNLTKRQKEVIKKALESTNDSEKLDKNEKD